MPEDGTKRANRKQGTVQAFGSIMLWSTPGSPYKAAQAPANASGRCDLSNQAQRKVDRSRATNGRLLFEAKRGGPPVCPRFRSRPRCSTNSIYTLASHEPWQVCDRLLQMHSSRAMEPCRSKKKNGRPIQSSEASIDRWPHACMRTHGGRLGPVIDQCSRASYLFISFLFPKHTQRARSAGGAQCSAASQRGGGSDWQEAGEIDRRGRAATPDL